MEDQTVAILIPEQLYQRLERLAALTNHSLEQLVVQTLSANVPPLPDDIPDDMRDDLIALETLDDAALWQVAHSVVSAEQHEQLVLLLDKQEVGTITDAERAVLSQLQREADRAERHRSSRSFCRTDKFTGGHFPGAGTRNSPGPTG